MADSQLYYTRPPRAEAERLPNGRRSFYVKVWRKSDNVSSKRRQVGARMIKFRIEHNSHGYAVIRQGGKYNQHSHHKTIRSCNELIKLISLNKLPRSKYLRGSCKRLLTNKEYELLRPGKDRYYNVNKGVR